MSDHTILPQDAIRDAGWAVAVHNDYRQSGKAYTFWLFTKGERFVKGEGESDAETLRQVLEAIDVQERTEQLEGTPLAADDPIRKPVSNEEIAAEANNNDGFQVSFTRGAKWMRTQLWPRIRYLLERLDKVPSSSTEQAERDNG